MMFFGRRDMNVKWTNGMVVELKVWRKKNQRTWDDLKNVMWRMLGRCDECPWNKLILSRAVINVFEKRNQLLKASLITLNCS